MNKHRQTQITELEIGTVPVQATLGSIASPPLARIDHNAFAAVPQHQEMPAAKAPGQTGQRAGLGNPTNLLRPEGGLVLKKGSKVELEPGQRLFGKFHLQGYSVETQSPGHHHGSFPGLSPNPTSQHCRGNNPN